MQIVIHMLQVAVALGLLNVWLLRIHKSTSYRGGDAGSMREEFAVYGLPVWCMFVVGALKVGAATALIAGLWLHSLTLPAAILICVLMLGALAMHIKVRDPLKKSLPAIVVLMLAAIICFASTR